VSLTSKGKELIAPIFRKHTAEIRKVFADASPKELRALEATLKKIGKRADHRYESCPGEECKERSRLFGLNERTKSAPVFLQWLRVHPFFDSVRNDPRFKDLLRRVGLDQTQ
jgi:hypothetical protein